MRIHNHDKPRRPVNWHGPPRPSQHALDVVRQFQQRTMFKRLATALTDGADIPDKKERPDPA
jgi:hypothetical protein